MTDRTATKQIINPNFNYGNGDDGDTQPTVNGRTSKSDPIVRFYNQFEIWTKQLCEALDNLEPTNERTRNAVKLLTYLRDHAYCLGAQAYTQNVGKWTWDAYVLDFIDAEIKSLEPEAHNFLTPNVSRSDLLKLEELRLQTRTLESFATLALPTKPDGRYATNYSIINRLSSYIYLLENYLRVCYGDDLPAADWTMESTPEFRR
jgi:cob(I)alamin adenosyltransferase